jgi:hypothetical protein
MGTSDKIATLEDDPELPNHDHEQKKQQRRHRQMEKQKQKQMQKQKMQKQMQMQLQQPLPLYSPPVTPMRYEEAEMDRGRLAREIRSADPGVRTSTESKSPESTAGRTRKSKTSKDSSPMDTSPKDATDPYPVIVDLSNLNDPKRHPRRGITSSSVNRRAEQSDVPTTIAPSSKEGICCGDDGARCFDGQQSNHDGLPRRGLFSSLSDQFSTFSRGIGATSAALRRSRSPLLEGEADRKKRTSKNSNIGGAVRCAPLTDISTLGDEDTMSTDEGHTLSSGGSRDDVTLSSDPDEAMFGHLTRNHYALTQLGQLKRSSEESPVYVRVPVILLSLAGVPNTLVLICMAGTTWTVSMGICAFHFVALSSVMLLLEMHRIEVTLFGAQDDGRVHFFLHDFRTNLRNQVVRYVDVLRLLWGRGCLCIFAGSMSLALASSILALVIGSNLVVCGLVAVMAGARASSQLGHLKASLTSDALLRDEFTLADRNKEGKINCEDFSILLFALGLKLDDFHTHKAYSEIVYATTPFAEKDATISFSQFKAWFLMGHSGRLEDW